MDNEFDFEDLSFENDFQENFDEDFENEFELEEITDVQVRTIVLSKNDMIALLCLKTADQGGAICRVDPREANPSVQVYDDPEKALEWFTKSLRTSRNNGWRVVYDGLPLMG